MEFDPVTHQSSPEDVLANILTMSQLFGIDQILTPLCRRAYWSRAIP
jgi:hypothetical protein